MNNCFSNLNNYEVKDAQARNSIEALSENISNLETDNTANKNDINGLRTESETNKNDINDLKLDNESNKTDIENLKTDNSINKNEITLLKADNTTNKSDIATLKEDVININTDIDGINKYSTNEVIIGKWINNKTIYRRVIEIPTSIFGTGSATAGALIKHNHGVSDMNYVVSAKLVWYRTNDATFRELPSSYYANADWDGAMNVNKTQLYFELGKALLNSLATQSQYIYAILEYTKTNDGGGQ